MDSCKILIVDDHDVVRRVLRSLFFSHPEWTICAEAVDGLEAIEKAKALRPDIIVMDISMPRMNGLEATRVIRKEVPESQVVTISQNDPSIARRQAEEVEAAGFIPKIELPHQLVPLIAKLLGTKDTKAASVNRKKDSLGDSPMPDWLAGGGIMGRMIREHDWTMTPLGPIDNWPQSLKTSINLILNSQHPMWIGWGRDITFIYNDAYIQVLSLAKHPEALGKPAAEVWAEIWDICGPLADKVFQKGEASFVDEVRLLMNRGEFVEETYYSFSYSPIRDESGKVAGLFCPSTEVTPKVINARRLQTLSELSAHALVQKTVEAACQSAIDILGKNPDDVPFALLYLIDDERKKAKLEQICGVPRGARGVAPDSVNLAEPESEKCSWPLTQVSQERRTQLVSVKDLEGLPLGLAQQRLTEAIVLPVTTRGEERSAGVLIVGISPNLRLDSEYRTFFELVSGQIATAIQNARASEEERKRLEALAEIDRAKTTFFSNVSHEFRTPLTLMLGPVEELLARSHTDLAPAAKRQLELVNRNGSRLLRLVNTLLDFSRIEAGRMQAIYQPTDLAAFTVELASVFRSATERAGLKLEIDCPKLGEPVFVDRGMWEKIVLNLLSNAFKFTFEGEIAVSLAQAGDNVELRVRDTGVGISPREIPRLFDRFHRIENTRSRTHEGSGIGLALVQELVKLHVGSVRAESTPGQGTTFILSVPRGMAHLPADRIGGTRTLASTAVGAAPFVEEALRWLPDADREAEEEILPADELIPVPCPPLSDGDKAAEKRPYILVADDNADMRQYLARLLAERYEVKAVADGELALASVRERSPDLVLTDVMMPNLDGFGVLNELRSKSETRTIPVIMLSARAGEESRVEGMEHGADDYLIKPFSARELLARVQTHLQMARVRSQGEEALRRQRQRSDFVAQAVQVGFWFCDLPFDKLRWDANVKEHFWLPPEADVTIDTFYERIHPDDRERTRQAMAYSIANDERYDIEYRTLSPDGRQKWIRAMGRTFYDTKGNPKSFDGLTLDNTERKRAEERERQITAESVAATAKFRAVFEQTPVFAGIMAVDGTIIDANQLCLDACGYMAEQVLGRPFWETPWWRHSSEVQSKIKTATLQAAQGTPFRETLTYHWADGTERLVDFAVHPIFDDAGNILFLHPTGVDITDLKRAEENYRILAETLDAEVRLRTKELEQRNVEVVQQSEQLRDLSSRLLQAQDAERRHIARELHDSAGQTLAALGMILSQLSEVSPGDTALITSCAEECRRLVHHLSQEIRTTSYLLHPPMLDEIGLPDALSWYIKGLAERSGLDISLNVPKDFGRLSREMELVMFRLVQESLTNIHRHSGSKSALIRLTCQDESVVLEIQDEGRGITPEKLSQIQAQSSGVGLRGMPERVRQFEGQMNIESNSKGTKISFEFPLRKSPSLKSESAEQLEPTG